MLSSNYNFCSFQVGNIPKSWISDTDLTSSASKDARALINRIKERRRRQTLDEQLEDELRRKYGLHSESFGWPEEECRSWQQRREAALMEQLEGGAKLEEEPEEV